MSCAYSVSLFTDWSADNFTQVWIKQKVGDADPSADETEAAIRLIERHGGQLAQCPVHPLPSADGTECTAQMGLPGPWHDRLPHFRYAHFALQSFVYPTGFL